MIQQGEKNPEIEGPSWWLGKDRYKPMVRRAEEGKSMNLGKGREKMNNRLVQRAKIQKTVGRISGKISTFYCEGSQVEEGGANIYCIPLTGGRKCCKDFGTQLRRGRRLRGGGNLWVWGEGKESNRLRERRTWGRTAWRSGAREKRKDRLR